MKSQSIVVSSARSGTNYLLNAYSQVFPRDVVLKEIFRKGGDSLSEQAGLLKLAESELVRLTEANPLALWQAMTEKCAASGRSLLAKIFYYHQPYDSPLWNYFKNHTKIVHLVRGNQFDVFVSHAIARRTGVWQQFGANSGAQDVSPISIDRNELKTFIKMQEERIAWARVVLGSADYCEVFYEDIATSERTCLGVVGDIWKASHINEGAQIRIAKQKRKPNCELVSNYDEVSDLDAVVIAR